MILSETQSGFWAKNQFRIESDSECVVCEQGGFSQDFAKSDKIIRIEGARIAIPSVEPPPEAVRKKLRFFSILRFPTKSEEDSRFDSTRESAQNPVESCTLNTPINIQYVRDVHQSTEAGSRDQDQ